MSCASKRCCKASNPKQTARHAVKTFKTPQNTKTADSKTFLCKGIFSIFSQGNASERSLAGGRNEQKDSYAPPGVPPLAAPLPLATPTNAPKRPAIIKTAPVTKAARHAGRSIRARD
jgi:hypothetical protein